MPRVLIADKLEAAGVELLTAAGIEVDNRPGLKGDELKAALRAASQLGMTNKAFANVVGLSEATISRMRSKEYELHPDQKSYELAVLFVRLYRSLGYATTQMNMEYTLA